MEPFFINDTSTLYCADCMDLLSDMALRGKKVDKVITSPPYNVRPKRPDRCYDVYDDLIPNDEYIEWAIGVISAIDAVLAPNGCILWNMSYGSENTELMSLCVADIIRKTGFTLADVIVWKKRNNGIPNNSSPNKMTRAVEFVYVFCRRSEFMTFTTNKRVMKRESRTDRPVYENMYNFIYADNGKSIPLNHSTFSTEFVYGLIDRYVRPDDVVMDPFNGTGTTMVACDGRGIRGIYCELSEAQCEYAVKRLKSDVRPQSNVLDSVGLLGD